MPRLEITSSGKKQVVVFASDSLAIGRHKDNDIVLGDKAASRRHCVIEHSNGQFKLKDLDSHNGTWMGEDRVIEAVVGFGERIRIGATVFRLLPDEVALDAAPSLPTADVIVDDDVDDEIELPQVRVDKSKVATTLAVRSMVVGPLSKQLQPLLEACVGIPLPEGSPKVARDVRLLNRKSEVVDIDKARKQKGRPTEALDALRQLLFVAFRCRSTDIHFEPKAEVFSLRFRIDGQLHPVGEITLKMGTAILNVVKILCEIDIAKKSVVQEGKFASELPTRRVDFRINFTPTSHGQKLALRLLDKGAVPEHFENLGMELDAVAEMSRICFQDAGMLILAGPTGSGKTTTLYTALQTIDAERRNIVTIEDPVEYELPNATQISIDPINKLTFASVLSSILRQDPDVIFVGEIRDQETAKLAMQAATTGHLVFTTIHARDTVGTVFRLLDLGVEPFLVANAVTMCISQRLVRSLCSACKRPYRPNASVLRKLKLEDRPHGVFFQAVGCRNCMGVGYRERMALFEVLLFNPQLRDVILTEPTISEIHRAAGEWMFRTLADSGRRKIVEGVTTVEEIERVTGH